MKQEEFRTALWLDESGVVEEKSQRACRKKGGAH